MKDPVMPPGDARSVRPGEAVRYTGRNIPAKITIDPSAFEDQPAIDEADAHIAKLNILAAEVEAELRRGTEVWNRASKGGKPLTLGQISGIRQALKRIRKALV